jgi:hypothetical protein
MVSAAGRRWLDRVQAQPGGVMPVHDRDHRPAPPATRRSDPAGQLGSPQQVAAFAGGHRGAGLSPRAIQRIQAASGNAAVTAVLQRDPIKTKSNRIHGVGRWSIVDYETHIYRTESQMPTKPPTAKELAAAR